MIGRIVATVDDCSEPRVRRAVVVGVPLVIAAYAVVFRAHGIADTLWFLGDQQRDWMAVQGRFGDLPTVGTPVATGGVSLGPIFYWVLWLIRVVLTPWFGGLPHVGAVGLILLRAASDGLLAWALLRRRLPIAAGLAMVVFLVSSPFDAALASTIWNPGLATTFVNLAVVLVLTAPTGGRLSPARAALVATTAWLAVQAHTPAIFAALATFGYLVWATDRGDRPGWAGRLRATGIIGLVIVVWQQPYLWSERGGGGGASVVETVAAGVGRLFADPTALGFSTSVGFLVDGVARLHVTPLELPFLGLVMAAGAGLTAFAWRRDLAVVAVTLLPVALALAGYALVETRHDIYWLLALSTPLGLTCLLGLGRIGPRPVTAALVVTLLAVTVVAQPGRWREFDRLYKAPSYGAIVDTLRGVVTDGMAVSTVTGQDARARAVNPELLFLLLGGTLTGDGVPIEVRRDGELLVADRR